MIVFAKELLYEVKPHIGALLQEHFEELDTDRGRAPLNPDWERYGAAELLGGFLSFTARKDGELIGYASFFHGRHPHHKDLVLVSNDLLFLRKEHRAGRTGMQLIDFCDAQIAAKFGTGYFLSWAAKPGTALDSILSRMGYEIQDIVRSRLVPAAGI